VRGCSPAPGRADTPTQSGGSSALLRERNNSSPLIGGKNAGGTPLIGGKSAGSTPLDRIDRLLDAPDKIHIPERMVLEAQEEEGGREEAERRREKVESIRRMLGDGEGGKTESLLTLNQIIARQVKQRSRSLAAASAAAAQDVESSAAENAENDDDRSDSSPDIPLPLRQQRESFLI